MQNNVSKFVADESGAVTVDWVVLTAGIITMAILMLTTVFDGAQDLSGEIETVLDQQTIGS